MNALRNKVQLIGHLGNDPEIKNFDGGKKLANFTLATNESYKNEKGEKIHKSKIKYPECKYLKFKCDKIFQVFSFFFKEYYEHFLSLRVYILSPLTNAESAAVSSHSVLPILPFFLSSFIHECSSVISEHSSYL